MKKTGITILATIIALSGNYLGRLIDKRLKALKTAVLLIKEIKVKVNYLKMPLYDIISEVLNDGRYCEFDSLKNINAYISDGLSFAQSWNKCLEESYLFRVLKKDEKNLLTGFAVSLGKSDIDSQNEIFDTYITLLNQRIELIEKDRLNNIKLCNGLGILLAATVFILLY